MSDLLVSPAPLQMPRRWRFGNVLLDERTLELSVGGSVVKIDKKPLDVLLHLLQHAGAIVTKGELQSAVWPGRIISDSVLAKTLSRLREALHDHEEILIKTVRGHGYRLVAAVQIETTDIAGISAADAVGVDDQAVPTAGERRQLSVLCCRWTEDTRLNEQTDPELFRETMLRYHDGAGDIVRRHEGHVAQVLSHGITIFFGYPRARDDDAERAVRCGQALLQTLPGLTEQPCSSVRVGVHTGTVVIDADIERIPGGMTLGLTCGLAAQIESAAGAGELLISEATSRLVAGMFVTEQRQDSTQPGAEQPLSLHRVVQVSGVRERLHRANSLSPFVGRAQELSLLTQLWQQAYSGHGHAVLLTAEPGLGKSRLLLHFRQQLGDTDYRWLECRANALTRDKAYQPIVDMLLPLLQLCETDCGAASLRRLEKALLAADENPQHAIPLLGALFGLPLDPRYPPSPLAPEARRLQTNELLSRWLLAQARQQPLLLTVEDLHWTDASTRDVLNLLLDQLPSSRMLILMTTRPEFVSPWQLLHLTRINLPALGRGQVDDMLDHLTGNRTLSPVLTDIIRERSNGVPLFVEELTRNILESGQTVERDGLLDLAPSCDSRSIPTRLQDLLTARLDRLGSARVCAQIASAIDREIPHRLLALVAGCDEPALQTKITRLTDAGMLYSRGTPPQTRYAFKHALIRDAAYNSMLNRTRRQLHQRIAEALETHFPDDVRNEPAVLAQHFEKAGNIDKALQYLEPAAMTALARSSATEAIEYCHRALSLLAERPDDESRASTELRILLLLHLCQLMLLGPGHADIGKTLARADAVRVTVGHPLLRGQALTNLSQHHLSRGELDRSLAFAIQIRQLDPAGDSPLLQTVAGIASGWSLWMLGDAASAWNDLESARAHLQNAGAAPVMQMTGSDGATASLTPMTSLAWLLGFPTRARELMQQALTAADASGDFYSTSLASAFAGTLLPALLRLSAGVAEASARVEDIARRHRFPGWESFTRTHRGLALCMMGLHQEGLPMLDQALTEQDALGSRLTLSLYRGLQAQHCLIAARPGDAAKALAQAASAAEHCQTGLWQAELHRLGGELHIAQDPGAAVTAEACFRQALEVSRKQQARSLELRAATSLARLLQAQHHETQALELLRPVYDGFTEGFDTPDLIDARALLDAIRR